MSAFFSQADKELNKIIEDINTRETGQKYSGKFGGLYKKIRETYTKIKIEGGLYNYYTPANIDSDSDIRIYMLLFEGIRLGGLLHDIGHPPYSHVSENALNHLYKNVSEKKAEDRNKKETEFLSILDHMVGEEHQLHEEMGVKIAGILLHEAIKDVSEDSVKGDAAVYEEQLYRVMVKEITIRILRESTPFFKDLHGIIDGTLDGDRLDYVSRDPENSGFQLGRTEFDRLIHKIKLCKRQSFYLFCPASSTVNAIEDFLIKRWNLYKNIVYHHRVVKTDYLLQNIIVKLAEDYFENEDQQDGDNSYILPYDISGLWKANMDLPSDKEMAYSINQWTDAWLITVLKTVYFQTYIDSNAKGYLNDQLEEFLTNRKHYDSLIKRREEFQEIDFYVSESISERANEIKTVIDALKQQSDELKQEKLVFNIEGYIGSVIEIIDIANNRQTKSFVEKGGFILSIIKKKIFEIEPFSIILDQMMKKLDFKPGELFYAEKTLKTGIGKTLYFYRSTNKEEGPIPLDEISNISYMLNDNVLYSPFFFLYLNKKSSKNKDFHELRKVIGIEIGNHIVDYILNTMNGFIMRDSESG